MQAVRKHYGPWDRKSAIPSPCPPSRRQTKQRAVHIDWPQPTQPRHIFAWHTPAARLDTSDAAIQTVLTDYLVGPTSPLYKELVLEQAVRPADWQRLLHPPRPAPLQPRGRPQGGGPPRRRRVRLQCRRERARHRQGGRRPRRGHQEQHPLRAPHGHGDRQVRGHPALLVRRHLRHAGRARPPLPEGLRGEAGRPDRPSPRSTSPPPTAPSSPSRRPEARSDALLHLPAPSPSPPRCASAPAPPRPSPLPRPRPLRPRPRQPAPAPAEPKVPDTVAAVPLKQPAPLQVVVQANPANPIVSFRLVFHTGSVDDPKGKEGLTSLTADVLSEGGTQSLTSAQLLEALFPMAAELSATADKEFTVFAGRVHKDLPAALPRHLHRRAPRSPASRRPGVRAAPRPRPQRRAQRAAQRERRGARQGGARRAPLRRATPTHTSWAAPRRGSSRITLDDVKAHAARVFTQDRLVIGLARPGGRRTRRRPSSRACPRSRPPAPRAWSCLPCPPPGAAPSWCRSPPSPPPSPSATSRPCAAGTRTSSPWPSPSRTSASTASPPACSSTSCARSAASTTATTPTPSTSSRTPGTTYNRTNVARTQQDISLWIRPVEPGNGMFATRGACTSSTGW